MYRTGADAQISAVDGSDPVLLYLDNRPNNLRVEYTRLTPPQISDGSAVGYASLDPEQGIVVEQSDWSAGAGLDLQRQDQQSQNRYALADGVAAVVAGSISSGYEFQDIAITAPGAVATAEWRAQPIEYKGHLYAAFDGQVFVLDPSGESFTRVLVFSSPVLSMAVYKERMFFTFKGGTRYGFTDDMQASNPTVTVRNLPTGMTGDCMMIRSRNAADAFALVCVNNDYVSLSTGPSASSPVWSVVVGVGDIGAKLLSLKAIRDVLYIGKTNGLWYYDTANQGNFVNIEPQIGTDDETERYRSLASFGHSLFTSYSEGGVWRIFNPETDAPTYVNVRDKFNYYSYRGRSGQIRAMVTNHGYVLALAEGRLNRVAKTFPIDWQENGLTWDDGSGGTKSHRLMLYDPTTDTSHLIGLLSFTATDQMVRYSNDPGDFHMSIYIFGKGLASAEADVATPIVRLVKIPRDDVTPYRSTYAGNAKTGWFTTQWYDNYFPDWNKMLTRITLYCLGLAPVTIENGEITDGARIKVEYRTQDSSESLDESDQWALMGYITENRFQTLPATSDPIPYYTNPIRYKRIRFKFTFETDGSTPISFEQMVLHSLLENENRRRYRLALRYQDNNQLSPTPQGELHDLIRLKERHTVFKFTPVSERISWLEERLVTISDIGPDTEGVFGSGDPGDRGQRAVATVLDLTDLPSTP